MIKVLVVDDSIFMRNMISDMLKVEEDIEIIGRAKNGEEAIKMNRELKPDVITLDVQMPILDGLSALRVIMKESQAKVIMVSNYTKDGAKETLEALKLGAYDFLEKPSGEVSMNIKDIKKELIEKIRNAKYINMGALKYTNIESSSETFKKNTKEKDIKSKFEPIKFRNINKINNKDKIIAIGVSTGGPRALEEVLPKLPRHLQAPIVIVQHMPPKFTKSLADRLNIISDIIIKEAEDGEILKNGTAYIAPGGIHMLVEVINGEKKIKLDNKTPPYSGHCPSVNVLFKSIINIYEKNIIAVLMTGMGSDGAEYLKKIKDIGGRTIAQDEQSCIVYGMPKVAYEMGAVEYVERLNNISNKIMELIDINN